MAPSADVAHKHLRSALEFAVLIAAEGQKRKPALPYPKELKAFFGKNRLPAGSLGRIRRVIEADPVFRSRLSAGALPELVDEIGRLWLTQPDGWQDAARRLAADIEEAAASGDLRSQLKHAERRRTAAEQAAARTRAELLQLNDVIDSQAADLDQLRADLAKADEAAREMRTELVDVRVEIRHARDREAAAQARADGAQRDLAEAQARLGSPGDGGERGATAPADPVDRTTDIAAAARAARALAEQLDALLPEDGPARRRRPANRRSQRRPIALPGGVISTSQEAAEFLVRSDAVVLIDGYNVAKLQWPAQTLEGQRRRLIDAVENLVRRHGTDATIVFDGADVVGAHADRRRATRVMYSPAGTIADDVIRDEVSRLPASRPVVVVTNDAEIVRDVRAEGANTLPSNALVALF